MLWHLPLWRRSAQSGCAREIQRTTCVCASGWGKRKRNSQLPPTAPQEVCTDDTYKCLKVVYRVDLSEFHAGSGAVMMLSEPTGAFTTRTAAQRSAREVQAADALTCWIDSTQSRAEPAVASFTAPTLRGASIFPVVFFFLLFSICACSALRFGQLEDRELKAAIRNARRSLGRPTPPGDLRPAWSERLANWLATPLDWVWERTPAQSSTQANLPAGAVLSEPRSASRRRNTLTPVPPHAPPPELLQRRVSEGGGAAREAPTTATRPPPPPPPGGPPSHSQRRAHARADAEAALDEELRRRAPRRGTHRSSQLSVFTSLPPSTPAAEGTSTSSSAAAAPLPRRPPETLSVQNPLMSAVASPPSGSVAMAPSRSRRRSMMRRNRRRTLEALEAARLASSTETWE